MRHNRKKVIERINHEYKLLDKLVSTLSENEWNCKLKRSESKDPWTVKDALAHITHWKADAARSVSRQPKPIEERGVNITEGNHLVYLRWHNRSPKEVLAWHRQVQKDVLIALREVPESWFSEKDRNPDWPGDLDGHSSYHRKNDIETALKMNKNK
jgi:hypothetical protein